MHSPVEGPHLVDDRTRDLSNKVQLKDNLAICRGREWEGAPATGLHERAAVVLVEATPQVQ